DVACAVACWLPTDALLTKQPCSSHRPFPCVPRQLRCVDFREATSRPLQAHPVHCPLLPLPQLTHHHHHPHHRSVCLGRIIHHRPLAPPNRPLNCHHHGGLFCILS